MAELPRTPTPATMPQIRAALRRSMPEISERTLDYLTAHVAIENGNGRAIVQHNVGNLIATRLESQDYWRPTWFAEPGPDASPTIRRLHAEMLEGRQPSAFRAFGSLEEGLAHFVELVRRERYRPLLEATTPEAYVAAWHSTGYTPDLDEPSTLRTFRQLIPDELGPAPIGPGGSALPLLVGVGFLAAVVLWRRQG